MEESPYTNKIVVTINGNTTFPRRHETEFACTSRAQSMSIHGHAWRSKAMHKHKYKCSLSVFVTNTNVQSDGILA